ncbi:protein of unknown function DUF1439 [Ferrimonas balearica DSM 9799]|uniref:Lipoprotein n=1 Tax=Ferrimonas balearica (strain DSM 9799 / CCM 4581 / KCTC 23876 / PAT) TaxID=550540 RepID=E1SMG7_FERBD|nr:DUF1439 domain-containing protein [Ferrimonas balearica]MBY6018503.1 DUF1439 domain-containing protein [Halomonas denitrificans]ADN74522.1 protein of unknown function DUF1439 [Ferrimonas balearica DSM 9799]MBW3140335.1 DUF1439 domain-containing protein [Ferrimonas balearica]MBW3165672.1 DUF1439 domain-containing protein [Ferrimonas balearica]MBY5981104.1 DUF1439 domain-containing protein [Ferrimonas balearica]
MRVLTLLLVTLGLGGCAASYSVTETELEGYLNNALRKEQRAELNPGLSATMTLSDIDVTIGDEAERVAIRTRSSVKVKTPLIPLRAELAFTFSAKPWYDSDDHSVYLKDVALSEVSASPEELEQLLIPLSREAMQVVKLYLENQPVYQLDQQGWKEDLLRQFGRELKVSPGQLEFVLKP